MNRLIRSALLVLAAALPAAAQESTDEAARLAQDLEREVHAQERAVQDQEKQVRGRERQVIEQERAASRQEKLGADDERYQRGTAAIDGGEWDAAIEAFESVAGENGRRTDAALYWKAYAQNKAGRPQEALAGIEALRQRFPQGRWTRQARSLEMEIRQASGQSPNPEAAGGDDELKLMALNGLMGMEAERALPLLEKFVASGSSQHLRERALFVLSQNGSPRARETVVRIARGQQTPELQRKAVEYLGLFGGPESRQALSDIYASASEVEVKKAVLRSFMLSGDKTRVLAAAKGEANQELRREAINQLGVMGAQEELWTLYQSETSAPVKRALINGLFIGGNATRLTELASREKDPEVRRDAVQHLALMGEKKTAAFLLSLYASEKDLTVKRGVLQGLFLQGNATALVDIARSEKDPALRRDAVRHLSSMHSKEATAFLLEILEK